MTREQVVREPMWAAALMGAGFVLAGAGAVAGTSWLLRLVANWLVTVPGMPVPAPVRILAALPEPQVTIGALAVGALGGLVLTFVGLHESLTVTVSREKVVLTRIGSSQLLEGAAVQGAFCEGKQLVVLGRYAEELAREPCDLRERRLAEAFGRHGYHWLDGDPYAGEFRRWVPGTTALPREANVLLQARREALDDKDAADDVRELREELARLGVVVRDDKTRQFWRLSRLPGVRSAGGATQPGRIQNEL
jgi:hypothetical protein